jgi:hypothetical protein
LTNAFNSPGSCVQRTSVSGHYLYFADFGGGLRICDISTPTSPALVAFASNAPFGPNTMSEFATGYGNLAFLVNRTDGIRIFVTALPP